MEYAVRRDGAARRRREHIFAVSFPPLLFENLYCVLSDGHASIRVFRLERCLHHLAVDPGNLAAYLDRAPLQVDVLPLEAQQLTPAQTSGQLDVVQLEHAALLGFVEKGRQLLGGESFHLPVLQFRQGTAIRGIGADQLLVNGKIHGGGNHLVDIADGFGTETFGLLFRFDPLHPSAAQQLFV